MNKFDLLYPRTEKTPFNFAQVQDDNDQPATFWEWVAAIEWDDVWPYLEVGVYAALAYVESEYPEFYDKYGDMVKSFLETLDPSEPPEDEIPVTEDDNTMLYLMIGMLIVIILIIGRK
ncbi:MAG: hypothetical protein ACOC80_14205 [Petrotogales bacterium]